MSQKIELSPKHLIGPYQLVRKLGSGVFCEVWLAEHTRTGDQRALKIPVITEIATEFAKKNPVQCKLSFDGIVKTIELMKLNKPPYFVMEYVEGRDLKQLISDNQKLSVDLALQITCQILTILDYTHRRGVFHFDLKPGNIIIGDDGKVAITDFRSGKLQIDICEEMIIWLNRPEEVEAYLAETYNYLAPEVLNEDDLDGRADIYSTGVILYQMLTGSHDIAKKLINLENCECSKELIQIVAKAVEKMHSRYVTPSAMRSDIEIITNQQNSQAEKVEFTGGEEELGRLKREAAEAEKRRIIIQTQAEVSRLESERNYDAIMQKWKEVLVLFPDDQAILNEINKYNELTLKLENESKNQVIMPVSERPPDRTFHNLKAKAAELERKGKFKEALAIWKQINQNHPTDEVIRSICKRLENRIKYGKSTRPSGIPNVNFNQIEVAFWLRILGTVVAVGVAIVLISWFLMQINFGTVDRHEVQTTIETPEVSIDESRSQQDNTPNPRFRRPPDFKIKSIPHSYSSLDSTKKEVITPVPSTPRPTVTIIPKAPAGFIFVPPGSYYTRSQIAGSNHSPNQLIWVKRGFFLSETEVTQWEWMRIITSNPSGIRGQSHPVNRVSMYDVMDYCNRRSSLEKLTPCYYLDQECRQVFVLTAGSSSPIVFFKMNANGYRLPLESEWEYACRAGTDSLYYWGDTWDCSMAMAENDTVAGENQCTPFYLKMGLKSDSSAPVKSFPANPFGLYDMIGNVQEWCWNQRSSSNSLSGECVLRGGSWNDISSQCNINAFSVASPNYLSSWTGFRIAKNIK